MGSNLCGNKRTEQSLLKAFCMVGSTIHGMVNGQPNLCYKGPYIMEPTHMAVKGLNNLHFEGPHMMRSTLHGAVKRSSNLYYKGPRMMRSTPHGTVNGQGKLYYKSLHIMGSNPHGNKEMGNLHSKSPCMMGTSHMAFKNLIISTIFIIRAHT